jgi:LacI family transcriptional regulator
MENTSEPCTMRQIAERLGLSVMTVSRALRNAPGVAVATHRRVLALARRLHYRPDPALAVLNAYRLGRRKRTNFEPLAFITNHPTPHHWKRVVTFVRYYEGACRRAEELGYRLEPFWVGDPHLTAPRASRILRDRGIRGLLVGPLASGQSSLDLEWDWFSAVALGRSLAHPGLTTVSTNHFQAVELAWQEAVAHEFRRIGLALSEHEDRRTVGTLRASYFLQQVQSGRPAIPVLLTSEFSAQAMAAWVADHRPDVLLGSDQRHHDLLEGKQRRSLSFIHLNVNPSSNLAGVDQGHDRVGEHAAALLHLKLIQRETGIPARREIAMLDGSWQEGKLIPEARETPALER